MLNFPFSSEFSGLIESSLSRKKLISKELIGIISNNLKKITVYISSVSELYHFTSMKYVHEDNLHNPRVALANL